MPRERGFHETVESLVCVPCIWEGGYPEDFVCDKLLKKPRGPTVAGVARLEHRAQGGRGIGVPMLLQHSIRARATVSEALRPGSGRPDLAEWSPALR